MRLAIYSLLAAVMALNAALLLMLSRNRKLRDENKSLRCEEARRDRLDVYCLHCEHGLTVVSESGGKAVVTSVSCGANPPCEKFSRATEAGQARKSKWRV